MLPLVHRVAGPPVGTALRRLAVAGEALDVEMLLVHGLVATAGSDVVFPHVGVVECIAQSGEQLITAYEVMARIRTGDGDGLDVSRLTHWTRHGDDCGSGHCSTGPRPSSSAR